MRICILGDYDCVKHLPSSMFSLEFLLYIINDANGAI